VFDFNGIDELKSFIGNLVRMDGFELVRQIMLQGLSFEASRAKK